MLAEFRREPSAANTREGLSWRANVETMRLMRIHHAAIIASDYQASKEFYTEILGLQVWRRTIGPNDLPTNWISPCRTGRGWNCSRSRTRRRDCRGRKRAVCGIWPSRCPMWPRRCTSCGVGECGPKGSGWTNTPVGDSPSSTRTICRWSCTKREHRPAASHNTAPWIVGPPHTVRSTGPHNVEP